MRRKRQGGFTLIELMIVVTILAIITTIAVSAYRGTVRDGELSRMISELSSLNDALARYYQGTYAYTGAADVADRPVAAVRGNIQASTQFAVTLLLPTAQTYFLIARPVAGGTMVGEGTYSVNETGRRCRFASDTANPATAACVGNW